MHVGHCRRACRGNGLFCFGDAGMKLRIHLLAASGGGSGRLFARLIGECLRASASFRQRLLVGRNGGVGGTP